MLKSIFSTATFKQSQITTLGTIINGALGALFYILMARFLGPSDFGLLAVSIVTLTLIADIADLGTNTGLVRFVSSYINSDKEKAFKFLKLGLEIKLIIWIVVLLLGFALSPFIAGFIFKKSELLAPLRLVMVGVGGALLFSYATSSLQSLQKYFSWSLISILINLLRLILLGVLVFYQQLNLQSGLIVYLSLPFFGFFLTLLLLPTRQILSSNKEWSVARHFFNYNAQVAVFTFIAAISSRLDIFLNVRLLSSHEVGIYSAANQLNQLMPQLVGALGIVAAPKFASFQNIEQMKTFFKKFQLMVLGLAFLISLAIPASFYLIPLLYGSEYQLAIYPFIILLLAMIIFLISVPLHNSIIYYFAKPGIFIWVAVGHLLIISILGYFLISNYGVIGSAITVFIGMLFNLIAPLIWFLFRLRR